MNETRPLTKREQLEWYLKFLIEQKEKIENEIWETDKKLKLIKREEERK